MEALPKEFWETMAEQYPDQIEKLKHYLHNYYSETGLVDYSIDDSWEGFLICPLEYQLGLFIMFEDAQNPPPKNSLMITFQGLIQSDFQQWDQIAKAKKNINLSGLKVVGNDEGLLGLMENPPEKPFMPCDNCEDAIKCTFSQRCLNSKTNTNA